MKKAPITDTDESWYKNRLETCFNQLLFDALRFKVCYDPVTYNGQEYKIITGIPYITDLEEDGFMPSFSSLVQYYSPDVAHLDYISNSSNGDKRTGKYRLATFHDDVLASYICIVASNRLYFKHYWLTKEEIDRGYIDGEDVYKQLCSSALLYGPIRYDDWTLRELGLSGIKLDMLVLDGANLNDSFMVAFAKYHLTSLSHESVIRVMEYMRVEEMNAFVDKRENGYYSINCDIESIKSLHLQEWYFHIQCIFQIFSDYFISFEEIRTRDYILNYCKSRICDLKPAKLTQATANANGNSFSDKILVDVYKWLVERGHIAVQGADEEESLNHFIYITSGRNEDLVSPEMRKQRVKWIGKDKFIFVTFIKEIHGGTDDKNREPYIEWSEVPNQFDVDFGEPLNGAFARKVTRNECYKQRYTSRIRGHVDVRDLILVFRPETK